MKIIKLIAVVVFLPLCLSLLGTWELQRAVERSKRLEAERASLAQHRPEIEAIATKYRTQSSTNTVGSGDGNIGVLLSRLTLAQEHVRTLQLLTPVMNSLAKSAIAAGLVAAFIGALAMLGLRWAGRRAQESSEALLHIFTLMTSGLPYVLAGHIMAISVAISAIAAYEGLGAWHMGWLSTKQIGVMACALIIGFACVLTIWRARGQLRDMLHMPEAAPLDLLGRVVTSAQAPGLWKCVRKAADQLGVKAPQHIVVGVLESVCVSARNINLHPAGIMLSEQTLHIPIIYLGLLDKAETIALITYELAHFAGAEAEYSQRVFSVYSHASHCINGLSNSIASANLLQSYFLQPALMLARHFIATFDHAVKKSLKISESAADTRASHIAGHLANASARVRIAAFEPLLHASIDGHLKQAIHPSGKYVPTEDLPGSLLHDFAARAPSVPAAKTEDTNRRGTRELLLPTAGDEMDSYFAEPQILRMRLTEDFFQFIGAPLPVSTAELNIRADQVNGDVRLYEGARSQGLKLLMVEVPLLLMGLGTLALPMLTPEFASRAVWFSPTIGALLVALMLCLLPLALRMYVRANKTALLLTADHFVFPNLSAPIPIAHIASFSVWPVADVQLTLAIKDDAPLPEVATNSFFSPNAQVHQQGRYIQLGLIRCYQDGRRTQGAELAQLINGFLSAAVARQTQPTTQS